MQLLVSFYFFVKQPCLSRKLIIITDPFDPHKEVSLAAAKKRKEKNAYEQVRSCVKYEKNIYFVVFSRSVRREMCTSLANGGFRTTEAFSSPSCTQIFSCTIHIFLFIVCLFSFFSFAKNVHLICFLLADRRIFFRDW